MTTAVGGHPGTLAAAAAAAVQAEKRHGAAGGEGGAGFIPFLLSGETVAVEDALQGGFHHPAAGGPRPGKNPPLRLSSVSQTQY